MMIHHETDVARLLINQLFQVLAVVPKHILIVIDPIRKAEGNDHHLDGHPELEGSFGIYVLRQKSILRAQPSDDPYPESLWTIEYHEA
jgi:hypothetical protein